MKYQDFRELFQKTEKKSKKPTENVIYSIKKNPTKGIQEATKLTQKQIAEKYGMSTRTLEEWNAGRNYTNTDKFCMLTFCVLSDLELI